MIDKPLFESVALLACELAESDLPALQALFDANPEYFLAVNGRKPGADLARVEFEERPPPHLSHTRQWTLGLYEKDVPGTPLAGVAIVVADLCTPAVWHVALFLVATRLHGQGVAGPAFQALQAWMREQGARWLRLGVVVGNARAEAFWNRQGFAELRRREGVDTGGRINDISVRLKPLRETPGEIDAYLEQVPRDRPGSVLP
jgi:GNAT superfamily N-acetyltransferase